MTTAEYSNPEATALRKAGEQMERERFLAELALFSSVMPESDFVKECTNMAQEVMELRNTLNTIAEILFGAPELNMSNFDIDQVADLNSAVIEACTFLQSSQELEQPK